MSLWGPYAFSVTGQPVPPVAPPALRVMGGPATAQQLAMAQHVYSNFCTQARLSVVPNPTAQGALPDGTRYTISVVGPQSVMTIWPTNSDDIKAGPGVAVFYSSHGFYRVWMETNEWRAAKFNNAFCGLNVQRKTSDGSYFTDNVATTNANEFNTRLSGRTRRQPRSSKDGVSATPNGYLLECEEKGEFNFGIALAEGFAYLSLTGDTYKILTATSAMPSGTPAKLTEVAGSGSLEGQDTIGIMFEYSRRVQEKFLLVSQSVEEAPRVSILVGGVRALALDGIRGAMPGELVTPAKKNVVFFTVNGNPPYGVESSSVPSFSGASHVAEVSVVRKPSVVTQSGRYLNNSETEPKPEPGQYPSEIYVGSAQATAVIAFQVYTKEGYTKTIKQNSDESQWLRECVSYDGRRYTAQLTTKATLAKVTDSTDESFGKYVTTSTPTGRTLELPGDSLEGTERYTDGGATYNEAPPKPTWDFITEHVTVIDNSIESSFSADGFSIPLFKSDAKLTIGNKYFKKTFAPLENNVERNYVLSGSFTVCVMLGYEEKTFISFISEDTYDNFVVTRPFENQNNYTITATRTSRICIYRRDTNVWASPEETASFTKIMVDEDIAISVPIEVIGHVYGSGGLGAFVGWYKTREASGWVSLGGSNGYWSSPAIYTAAALNIKDPPPILGTRYGGSSVSEDTDTLASHGVDVFMFDYTDMRNRLKRPSVRFAVDPKSGGCAVISPAVNLLVSPGGDVTQLSDVTGVPDNRLDNWCASL